MDKIKILQYDIVICGAGPAGLKAAYEIQKKSRGIYKVLLLDKKEPWTEPAFCAEAVSLDRLSKLWEPKKKWVRQSISGIYFTSPSRKRAEFYSKDCGVILNRPLFHKDIADAATDIGVLSHFNTQCTKLNYEPNGQWNLSVKRDGEALDIRTTVLIDATGAGAKLSKSVPELAGLEAGNIDLESAIFAIVEGVEHSKEHIELFFGSEFPGGYAWLFPRDHNQVNIGLVLGRDAPKTHSLKKQLERFISKDYPNAKIKGVFGGMIACGQSKKAIARNGYFKVGDSASVVNPISRSGIVESMLNAELLSDCVLRWMSEDSFENRQKIEKNYLDLWMKALGKEHMRLYKAKRVFSKVTDKQFNKATHRLSRLSREKTSLFRIVIAVLISTPSLIWKMRSFIR
ncbi:MAG: NAD(P)/FAD-dependent oxidoreductase [Fibrobacter sp.]|nr:NAD(P)/FAD-dependent oxidoreductase [Fibrobacter sp.]